MLRLLGGLCVIFSCSAFAYKQIARKQNAKSALEQLSEFLLNLKQYISFNPEPLPDLIVRHYQKERNGFSKLLADSVSRAPHDPISLHWQKSLTVFSESTSLTPAAKSIMEELGNKLGTLDLESETTRLETASGALSALAKKEEEKLEKSDKTVKSLGVLTGVLIVILLL